MNTRHLVLWLPCLVILAMLANLITPAPVLAAGEPPPPPGEKSPKSAPTADKPAPPASDASYTAEPPTGSPDGAANAAAVAFSVDAIAQAGAVLVGPDGSLLPLAAQETAGVLAFGDVYFKGSGGAECSDGWCNYDTIAHALAAFPTNHGTGAIFATGALNELTAVDVVSTPVLNLSKLTGLAWDGTTNNSPSLTGGLLTIANMLKGFTVDGFYIGHGISAHDNAGTLRFQNLLVSNPFGSGIDVTSHKGNIDLTNVNVYKAAASGVRLDNTAGTGNITISNSTFILNQNYGIWINTNGTALLDRVEASNNLHSDGALLQVKAATVKDSRFNDNLDTGRGLVISNAAAISLQNVEARGNVISGVKLGATQNVIINGGTFLNNTGPGIDISSGGNITLKNILAQSNSLGVIVDNQHSATPKTVTVSNSTFLNTPGGPGLTVNSRGSITLNHIRAESNNGAGVELDNALYDLPSHTYKGSGSINILNTSGNNQFAHNLGAAGYVTSKGAITVKGVNSIADQYGLWLNGCAPDFISHLCLGKGNISVTATQVISSMVGFGLAAVTGGAITLDGGYFYGNLGGVALNNSLTTSAKAVTVNNSEFSVGVAPTAIPLNVASKGNITLNNVRAFSNAITTEVIKLDNCFLNGGVTCTGSGSVSVLNSLGATLLKENHSTSNSLSISSHGAVTLTGVVDDFNKSGAKVENDLGTAAVTVSKSSFSHNTVNGGLKVLSRGKITLTSVVVAYNGDYGANLMNADLALTAPASSTITISKSTFDYNHNFGLLAIGMGAVTANNISASYNLGATTDGGALGSAKGNVTLQDSLGPNQFNYNGRHGLIIVSGIAGPGIWGGNISIRGVTARNNLNGYGISLDNQNATTPKTVTAQKVTVEGNGQDGLDVLSKGSVTLNNVQANYNSTGYGVKIDNCLLPAPCVGTGNVAVLSTLGPNSMKNNLYGMSIDTQGSVVLNDVTASFNTGAMPGGTSGVYVTNQYQILKQKPVTVTHSSFDFNQGAGLGIYPTGVATLNGVSANYNATGAGYGVRVYNNGETGSPGINILGTAGLNQFTYNSMNGMMIKTSGNITLNKVTASANGIALTESGAILITDGTHSSITITCSAFNYNGKYGLEVVMGSGVLTFKSAAASHNLGGVDLSLGGKVPVMRWTVCGH